VLLIKTSAFCWNNNCVIINMHGKTTLEKNSYSDFPSTLHCHENCLLHAHPLHISIITWPFQSPLTHSPLCACLPAIRIRPFRVFIERGHDEFARNVRTRWNNGLMASPILSPYFWTKRIVDRLHHNCVRRLSDTSTLATRDITFLYLFVLRIFISTYT
jgi:hypothetical protein